MKLIGTLCHELKLDEWQIFHLTFQSKLFIICPAGSRGLDLPTIFLLRKVQREIFLCFLCQKQAKEH